MVRPTLALLYLKASKMGKGGGFIILFSPSTVEKKQHLDTFFFKPLVTLTHFIIQVDTGLHFCSETQPYLLVMSYRLPSLQIVVVPCLSGQVTNPAVNRSEVLREPQASCPCL